MTKLVGETDLNDRTGSLMVNLYNLAMTDGEMAEAIVNAAAAILANDARRRGEEEPIHAVDRFAVNLERNFDLSKTMASLYRGGHA